MSKVKDYVDSKSKAIHRMRRHESRKKNIARKKLVFIKPYLYKGYCLYGEDMYVEQNGVQTRVTMDYEDRIFRKDKDGTYLLMNEAWVRISGHHEPHVKKVKHGHSTSYYSERASRKLRHAKIDFDSVAYHGGEYKKNYDVAWLTN